MDQRKETKRTERLPLGVSPKSAGEILAGKLPPQAIDLEMAVLGAEDSFDRGVG